MHDDYRGVGNQSPLPLIDLLPLRGHCDTCWESVTSPFDRLTWNGIKDAAKVGNQSPLPLIDLPIGRHRVSVGWESVTSPFDRLTDCAGWLPVALGISHLSL